MKKIIAIMFVLALTACCGAAQAEVRTHGLSEIQKAELALQAAKMKETVPMTADGVVGTLTKFGGMGKEVGDAVASGLNAVVDVAEKFGGTSVGQITIALIVWRVAGADIMLLLIAIITMSIGIWLFKRMWFRQKNVLEYENVPVLWGLYVRRLPVKVECTDVPDESKFVGAIGLLAGTIVMVVALANIGG